MPKARIAVGHAEGEGRGCASSQPQETEVRTINPESSHIPMSVRPEKESGESQLVPQEAETASCVSSPPLLVELLWRVLSSFAR